ncbi:MAG: type VI secretion protein IcmF [Legionella sp.]|nr:MAG: type VI secretion protein IcmF [Legionella sp.]
MTNSLNTLCDALKQIVTQLKPKSHPLSFLLLTGRSNQGKSTLMRQSHFDQHPIDAEGAHIYFNQHGVIVELGEAWINQSEHLLEHTVKQLNRVHRSMKINGVILCVDINELLTAPPGELKEYIKANAKLVERFGLSLNYQLDIAIVLTKLDLLAGFCDFFQSEHPLDLVKPMGFSIYDSNKPHKAIDLFKTKFEQLIEQLGHQVTDKIHPIRSQMKRTLIREFPLQVASLRNLILPLISSISSKLFRLQALYFTSGEQGGLIQDRLNKKIQHEFALVVQDEFYQSTNYRSYFIEGALFAFQTETQRLAPQWNPKQLRTTFVVSTASFIAICWIGYHHITSLHVLNSVKQELQMAHHLENSAQAETTIYHLAQATTNLDTLTNGALNLPMIKTLKTNLTQHTQQQLVHSFIPTILQELEQTIQESHQSQINCYQALRIYLMLTDRSHFQESDVLQWFTQHWQTNPKDISKKLALLKQILNDTSHPIVINPQIISDARNYLNALPTSYLYYALAKTQFDAKTIPIEIKGFRLGSTSIPEYLTKAGFQQTMGKLPSISKQLQAENWVLQRQDLQDMPTLLQDAYTSDYVLWWQNFLHHTQPMHAQNYAEVGQLAKTWLEHQSITKLIQLIQTHTHPETNQNALLFNRDIASKFSDINLLSQSNMKQLSTTIRELEKFTNTLSLVSDQGKTAFSLTKARFQKDTLTNPISELYAQSQQFPEPLSAWINQIANDMWFTLISDTRTYINHRWQTLIYKDYKSHIANRYPLDSQRTTDLTLTDFNRFFAPHGMLNQFAEEYLKPFLDTSKPQWQRKELNHSMVPISDETINELMRANVITHMFFPNREAHSHIEFSLQKINLDPVVSELQLTIGTTDLMDNQTNDSYTEFQWPQGNARLIVRSIEGKQFELSESGTWAFFKLLQKVNVLVDEQDSSNLQILFEINGNSGRYLLKTQNQVNPFIPGILSGFSLKDSVA